MDRKVSPVLSTHSSCSSGRRNEGSAMETGVKALPKKRMRWWQNSIEEDPRQENHCTQNQRNVASDNLINASLSFRLELDGEVFGPI